jgi:hypothetical protein
MATDPRLAERIRSAAILIRDAAKGFASWSRHIPDRISVQMRDDTDGAYIIATGGQARAYELHLRHPLNYPGQKGWGNTPWRPFLSRAVDSQGDAAAAEIANVVNDWLEDDGWDTL